MNILILIIMNLLSFYQGNYHLMPEQEVAEKLKVGIVKKGLTLYDIRQSNSENLIAGTLFLCTDNGKKGLWFVDENDITTPDDNSTCVVVSGKRIKRVVDDYVYPEWFGAGGNEDESTYLQNAINYCDANKLTLRLQPRDYIIKRQLKIKNVNIVGVPRKSRIIIAPDFVFTETITGRNYTCILNNDYNGNRNNFSNEFYLSGVDIELRIANPSSPSVIGLANIKKALIDNCNIKILGGLNGVNGTNIDLWASCKNVTIQNCKLENLNESEIGGVVWVRNITNNGENTDNNNENIIIRNNVINSSSKDEPLAIYGVQGVTKNVTVSNNVIEALPSNKRHSVLLSVFPLNNGTPKGYLAAVENITIEGNTFIDKYFESHVLRVGQSGLDIANKCDSIFIKNNKFYVSKSLNENSYVMRNIKCVGNNVRAEKNTIYVDDLSLAITNGVSGFDVVEQNYFKGKLNYCISYSKRVSRNEIDNCTGSGILNSEYVENNNVVVSGSPIVINSANTIYQVINNYLESSSTVASNSIGIYLQSLGGLNPFAKCEGNIIKMNYIGNYALRREGNGGFDFINNTITGNGATVLVTNGGTTGKIVKGNSWYGILDDIRSTAFNSVNSLYPISSTTQDSTSKVKYIKVSNTGASVDWSPTGIVGSTILVDGIKVVNIQGVTALSSAILNLKEPIGNTDTKNYKGVCVSGQLIISALKSDGTVNTQDKSEINFIIN